MMSPSASRVVTPRWMAGERIAETLDCESVTGLVGSTHMREEEAEEDNGGNGWSHSC